MIAGKRVLAVIPARGGSKGVSRKNIRQICGKPLIGWTIEAAKKSKYIDRLILSSEDKEIIRVAKEWGCEVPFIRPTELAKDETLGVAPALHAVRELPGYDYLVFLQPTSPLRIAEDIDKCLEMCEKNCAPSCASVFEPDCSPYLMYTLKEGTLHPILGKEKIHSRRQDLPKVYALNGAVYVAKIDWVLRWETLVAEETIGYVMPRQRSIDIDDEIDLYTCNSLLSMKEN